MAGLKVLITGCSLSADANQFAWLPENLRHHYSNLLRDQTNWHVTNRAIGGCSNREITLRTVENCSIESYDFCIVQWSSLHRHWVYESDKNIDNFTQILPKVCGWASNGLEDASMLQKILISKYLNDYVALKHWFLDQLSLQNFFLQKKVRYVFIRGFPNFIPDFEYLARYESMESVSEITIPDSVKKILDFDSNPDHYLLEKLQSLVVLYKLIDQSNCIGYNNNETLFGIDKELYSDDWADDGAHPGAVRNALLAKSILEHCTKKGIKI